MREVGEGVELEIRKLLENQRNEIEQLKIRRLSGELYVGGLISLSLHNILYVPTPDSKTFISQIYFLFSDTHQFQVPRLGLWPPPPCLLQNPR